MAKITVGVQPPSDGRTTSTQAFDQLVNEALAARGQWVTSDQEVRPTAHSSILRIVGKKVAEVTIRNGFAYLRISDTF